MHSKTGLSKIQDNVYKTITTKTDIDANIYIFNLNNKICSEGIVEAVLRYKNNYPTSNQSYVKSWHSDFFMHLRTDDFNELIFEVENRTRLTIEEGKDCKVAECWGIIYNEGDKTDRHKHDNLSYAAVYYAYAKNCQTPLKFDNGIEIVPKTGMLIVFPGYLHHWVPKIENEDKRITVAFNISSFYISDELFKKK